MADVSDFSGLWHFVYWYPSNKHSGDDQSEYTMQAYRHADNLILESLPNEEKSYMLVRLKIAGDIATGNWHETTSPTGEFKGALYSGAGQLIIDPQTSRMEGQWAGAGYDHDRKQTKIYSGKWEITPIQES